MTCPRPAHRLCAVYVTLIAVAALWGAATGLLLPRAAYRLSVAPMERWRDRCPAGHPFTGPWGGWLGGPRCAACAAMRSDVRDLNAPDSDAPLSGPVQEKETGAVRRAAAHLDPGPGPSGEGGSGAGRSGADRPRQEQPSAPPSPQVSALITALACVALAAAVGYRPELAVWLLLTPFAVLLALVDVRVHRLPDQLTLPLALAAAVLLGLAALLPGAAGSWSTALLGGVVLGAVYCVLFVIHPNGMGFGDVKLALGLGVLLGWYGWGVLFVGAFAGFVFGSLYGFGLMALGRAHRKSAIPFGPFMITGAFAGLLLGALALGNPAS